MAIDTTVTLKRQIVELNEWATAHPMVNDFGYGQYLEVYKQSGNKYLTLVVNSPTLTSEDFFVNYSWEVICLDYVLDQKDNMQRVLSDTQDVLRDLENTVRYSKRWKDFSRADGNWSYRKVDEFGADKCFGWIATFTLKIKKKHGICDISSLMPTYDFETGSIVYPTCDPVLFAINGTDEDSFASGSIFNMLLVNQDGDIPAYSFDEVLGKLTVQTGGGGSVDIQMNGNTFLEDQTGTVDIAVWDENDDPTGFDDGGIWRIGNSNVNVNDNLVASLVPSSNLNLYTKDSAGNNIGTQNGNDTDIDDSLITLITQAVPATLTPLRAEQPKSLSIIDAIDFDPIQVTVASDTEGAATFVIPNATVSNSDDTYTSTVKAGGSLELPDETFYFQIDGVTVATETEPALSTQTFNINWN